ncbi:hypothetical protein [Cryobacterium sp. Y50]|uniref:hypothetical protein n=1 Tax=Cryobacterium sp. Y50 TaxID=2048286 RepID=UPI0035111282
MTLPLVTEALAAGLDNDAAVAILSLSAIVPPLALLTLVGFAGPRPHCTTNLPTPDVGEPE